jgi:hypothetical protein
LGAYTSQLLAVNWSDGRDFGLAVRGALPLIVTHGWPGSIIEQLRIVDPLVNPTAHGASASDAFDLVIPSIPGYGY